jgi:hypothetical protein
MPVPAPHAIVEFAAAATEIVAAYLSRKRVAVDAALDPKRNVITGATYVLRRERKLKKPYTREQMMHALADEGSHLGLSAEIVTKIVRVAMRRRQRVRAEGVALALVTAVVWLNQLPPEAETPLTSILAGSDERLARSLQDDAPTVRKMLQRFRARHR